MTPPKPGYIPALARLVDEWQSLAGRARGVNLAQYEPCQGASAAEIRKAINDLREAMRGVKVKTN